MNNFYNPYAIQGNYLQELNNMRGRIDNQIQQVQQQQLTKYASITYAATYKFNTKLSISF